MTKLKQLRTTLSTAPSRVNELKSVDKQGHDNSKSAMYRYGAWRTERAKFLAANPLCEMCRDCGIATIATVVDHRHGWTNEEEFWDRAQWVPLCARHHNSEKQKMDHSL